MTVLIVSDHSRYDYGKIVTESKLIVDTRKPPAQSIARKSCIVENTAVTWRPERRHISSEAAPLIQ